MDQRLFLADNSGYNVSYIYNGRRRLSEIRHSASGELIAQYHYSDAGKLERKTLGNGAYTLYQYNGPNQQLSEVRNYLPGGRESTFFIYEYDKRGRITTVTTESGAWTYSYDPASQLIKWITPEGDTTEYTYDSRGNRLVQTRNGRREGYSVNYVNQYLEFNETESFVFDANGNLRQKRAPSSTESYTFDAEGKLIETETPDKRYWINTSQP